MPFKIKNMCNERTSERASQVSDQVSQTSDRVNEKNTVPVQLSLA